MAVTQSVATIVCFAWNAAVFKLVIFIVPTLRVGMPPLTLCVDDAHRLAILSLDCSWQRWSARGCIPTQSVGTIAGKHRNDR
jgi:hypothetical protein